MTTREEHRVGCLERREDLGSWYQPAKGDAIGDTAAPGEPLSSFSLRAGAVDLEVPSGSFRLGQRPDRHVQTLPGEEAGDEHGAPIPSRRRERLRRQIGFERD